MTVPLRTSSKHHGSMNILIASRNKDILKTFQNILTGIEGISLSTNLISNGHSDPLYGLTETPDLLIFCVGESWVIELEELMDNPASERPPLIICADNDDPSLMRLSMKAGALDYLKSPFEKSEITTSILSVQEEYKRNQTHSTGVVTAIMNAKGGSGSSFIACNIADLITESSHLDVALVGLDIQFGNLSGYLDMHTDYGLVQALDNIDNMDSTSLKAYMKKHSSGLDLLDAKPEALLMPEDIDIDKLGKLFDLMEDNYNHIVVDLPRQIDLVTSTVIDRADKILIVMQQSLGHLQDAKRLLEILRRDLGVANDSIIIAINRYDKESELSLASISKTLRNDHLLTVPNSFVQVNESLNEGEPLYSGFKESAITKSLVDMKNKLIGEETKPEIAGIRKIFNRIKGLRL